MYQYVMGSPIGVWVDWCGDGGPGKPCASLCTLLLCRVCVIARWLKVLQIELCQPQQALYCKGVGDLLRDLQGTSAEGYRSQRHRCTGTADSAALSGCEEAAVA